LLPLQKSKSDDIKKAMDAIKAKLPQPVKNTSFMKKKPPKEKPKP